MEQMQLTFLFTAINDTKWDQHDADGEHRRLSADELDARAVANWHWVTMQRTLAAWAQALGTRWRPRASARIAPMDLPSVDATAQG